MHLIQLPLIDFGSVQSEMHPPFTVVGYKYYGWYLATVLSKCNETEGLIKVIDCHVYTKWLSTCLSK